MLSSLQNRYFSAFWTMRKKSAAVQQQVPWEWGSIKCPENVVQLLWYKVQTSSLLLGHALYFFLVGVGNFPEFMKSWQFFHHWEVNLLLVNNCISWMFLIIICLDQTWEELIFGIIKIMYTYIHIFIWPQVQSVAKTKREKS